jgi:hypothetical protein
MCIEQSSKTGQTMTAGGGTSPSEATIDESVVCDAVRARLGRRLRSVKRAVLRATSGAHQSVVAIRPCQSASIERGNWPPGCV